MSYHYWMPAGDPWHELRRAHAEMDRLFRQGRGRTGGRSAGVFPAMNVCSDDRTVTVRCEMPGVPLDALDISLTRDTLTIKGQRVTPPAPDGVSYHRRERRGGHFNRTLNLPFEVDPEKARAHYKEGVLKVTVERAAATMPRQLTVSAG